jgi:hypothetical protein
MAHFSIIILGQHSFSADHFPLSIQDSAYDSGLKFLNEDPTQFINIRE